MSDPVSVEIHKENSLGEGPLWVCEHQRLYWLDIKGHKLFSLDPVTRHHSTYDLPMLASAVALTGAGDMLLACMGGLYRFDLEIGHMTRMIDFEKERPGNRPNDGKTDPQGRFWIGSMDDSEKSVSGALYCLDTKAVLTKHLDGIGISNTFAWSPDGNWFYHADSMAQLIWRFPWNGEAGTLGEREVFVSLQGTDRFPDGSCIDSEGYLWNAQWNGARVVRYAPDGTEDRVVKMPVACPTSCMFGGKDLDTLYITSARIGVAEADLSNQPQAGALFSIKPGVKGLAEARWAGP